MNIVHWVKPVAVCCALEKIKMTNSFPFFITFFPTSLILCCVQVLHFKMLPFSYRERRFLLDLSWARRVQTLVCICCVSTDKRLLVALVCVSVCPFASRRHCQSRNGLHSKKLFNKCCCWVEFARREQHTLHRFLDNTNAKKVHGISFF